jgi:hypothetical protein
MQPDHTAQDFAQSQSLLATQIDGADTNQLQRPLNAFARVTFCFAWLFGLEPFLTGPADELTRSRFNRH